MTTDSSADKTPKLPVIVYCSEYNVRFWGLERLHELDTCKFEKIAKRIQEQNGNDLKFVEPKEPISDEELLTVHTKEFLTDLYSSKHTIVSASEACFFYFLTMNSIRERLLKPLRYQTCGTLLACMNALKHGFAINLGGGFHHCSGIKSAGFCFFADITLSVRYVWKQHDTNSNVLIVDCDAHQGNGYAKDVLFRMNKTERSKVYILDLYNPRIYPNDEQAKQAISREVHLSSKICDDEYLKLLKYHLEAVITIDKFRPNFIIYNAGSDVLINDPLGGLSITPEGLRKRDEFVIEFAHKNGRIPIIMLLSGGYSRRNYQPVGDSINSIVKHNIYQ